MLLVITASTLWGTVGVASQALAHLTNTNPLSISYLRLVVAAPILLLAGWRLLGRRMWSASVRDVGLMMLIGVLIAADQALYFFAISLSGVTVATLIAVCSAPVLVTVLTAAIERKTPTSSTLVVVAIALIGTVLLVTGSAKSGNTGSSLTGAVCAVGSACLYAVMILFARYLSARHHSLQITALGFSTGAICLLIASRLVGFVGTYPVTGWLLILYIGAVPTALAYGLFVVGMRTLPAPLASVIVLLEPLTASVLSWVLFGERLSLLGITGALLLLSAIGVLSAVVPEPDQSVGGGS